VELSASVEVNNTFYRLPDEAAFERWREVSPTGSGGR